MRTVALALALVAPVLAACGGTHSAGTIAAAATATRDAGTARTSYRSSLVRNGRDEATLASGRGVLDFRRNRGEDRFSAPFVSALVGADEPRPPATLAVYDVGAAYVLLPSPEHPGRPWLKIDLERPAGPSLFPDDPGRGLEFLEGPHRDVRALERENVRGVETTRYRVEIDLERVADASPDPVRRRIRRGFAEGEPRALTVDVWIDGGGLIRRIRWEDSLPDEEGTAIATTREYFDFGVEAAIEIPPPGRVRTQA